MELNTHNQQLKVDAQNGAAITHLSLKSKNGGSRVLIQHNDVYESQSALLFPFPNRLENGAFNFEGNTYKFPLNDSGKSNALHGMIMNMPFDCVVQKDDSLAFELDYKGELDYYPFPFILRITYTLAQGSLGVKVSITNTGSTSMPCGFGWHPYFDLGAHISKAKLRMGEMMHVEVNDMAIPTGKLTPYHIYDKLGAFDNVAFDDCFIYRKGQDNKSVYLAFEDKTVLEVWQDQHQDYLQLFVHPNKQSLAIEPMTCGINALNNGQGLRVLAEGEIWDFKLGLRYA